MSREACVALLAAKDRSALVLSKYVPASSVDGWLALRAFNVETARVVDGAREPTAALARMQYWKAAVQRVYGANATGTGNIATSKINGGARSDGAEATPALLGAALAGGANIPKRYLLTLVQTREHQLSQPPIRNVEDLARIGEGTASQILYATLDMLQAREPGTTEFLAAHAELDELASTILAHIGQAQGIAASLRALTFYAGKQNRLLLPADVMARHNVIEQDVLNSLADSSNKNTTPSSFAGLRDAVFEVATAANDHILTARMLSNQFREQTGGKMPRSLAITSMASLPTTLYLERLQKFDFDALRSLPAEWRLPWRSWRSYRTRSF